MFGGFNQSNNDDEEVKSGGLNNQVVVADMSMMNASQDSMFDVLNSGEYIVVDDVSDEESEIEWTMKQEKKIAKIRRRDLRVGDKKVKKS